jgi:dipeptidyl aminopeptidase/acylaminoacyl peptidase
VPVEDVWVEGPGGRIHALLRRPRGADGRVAPGPLPLVVDVHGGPTHHDADVFRAYPSAWVDHGYAVVQVNYRGSTGYGTAWRNALEARVGHVELEDVVAVRDHLVAAGIADGDRVVLAGGSWGGYLTLLGLGTYPDRWAAGLAAVPVADYLAAYEDEMEALKAFDRSLFGGSPADVPERYTDSSPLTYVDAVRAPVLILAGENDPRCPIRQIENYVAALQRRPPERAAPYEVYRFDAGHGSLVDDERVRQTRAELDFAARHLPAHP